MEFNVERKDTIKVQFPSGAIKPTDIEMIRYVKKNNLTGTQIHTLYQHMYDRCIYIKFMSTEIMHECMNTMGTENTFEYANNTSVLVTVSDANVHNIYVRMFDVAPDIHNETIIETLAPYGIIKNITMEKWPASFGLDAYTSTRGITMELKREIPNRLNMKNMRVRVYYQGQVEACHFCSSTLHKQFLCPERRAFISGESTTNSYNTVVGSGIGQSENLLKSKPYNSIVALKSTNKPDEPMELDNMTQLNTNASMDETTSDSEGNSRFENVVVAGDHNPLLLKFKKVDKKKKSKRETKNMSDSEEESIKKIHKKHAPNKV